MPEFLDFVFPFGDQDDPLDPYFSAFRQDIKLSVGSGLGIPELGRSGQIVQMCYNLKSAEPVKNPPQWPWSIRQTAIYHSFDVITGKSVWIMIKGNDRISKRVKEETNRVGQRDINTFDSLESSFAASLAVQRILCDWAREKWRMHISFLEKSLEDKTRDAKNRISPEDWRKW